VLLKSLRAMGLPVQSRFSARATIGSIAVGATVCSDHPALPTGLNASAKTLKSCAARLPGFLKPDSANSVPMRLMFGRT
jgi:hypothetical protein